MAAAQSDDEIISGINVTPLVDIVLVLLIVFMVTAQSLSQRAIKMALPKAAHSEAKATGSVRVALTADNNLSLNGQTLTRPELLAQLKRMAAVDPGLKVSLAADGRVPWDGVSEILDDLRGAGVTKIGAEVRPKEKT